MDILPSNASLRKFQVVDLAAYLELAGWTRVNSNERWYVFQEARNVTQKPLEIVFPINPDVPDISIYIANAINLIAARNDISPENVVRKIQFYDRDVLMIRIAETGGEESIPVALASKQVPQLRQLVAYSASSEKDAKPNFNTPLRISYGMVEHFRFGQTFSGSFGYTIESPIVGTPSTFFQKSMLEDVPDEIILPLERRVMERIVRGLIATQEAVRNRDVKHLVTGYTSGFNANMCLAITKMVEDRSSPVDYSVLWSEKIPPSDDVSAADDIRINSLGIDYLEHAAAELRELKPEYTTIAGRVTGLSSSDDPLSSHIAERAVIVKWIRQQGRPVNVRIVLNKDEYVLACTTSEPVRHKTR